jgi:GT2 family glycosyltransferase/glycosyltransferase involved in cell wall biosynthesis
MAPSPRPTRLSILVVHSELPLHDRNAGSLRLRRLLELMVADGHRVTFLGRAGVGQERYAEELRALGIEVHPVDAQRLRARGVDIGGVGIDLPALLRRGRFDLAWLSFYDVAEDYLSEIRAHSPATRIAVDTVDVHHVRERRGAELSGDAAALGAAERTRAREAAVYGAADALIAVSDDDARALRELAPAVPVHVVSLVQPAADPGPAFDERCGLVFVGNFAHAPNADAITHFCSTAWPSVREAVPGARLTIVGTQPSQAVRALAAADVEVTGWVADVAPYLHAARVAIAPLRFGAGVKGKIAEALGHGLPVVSTPIGVEGMALRDGHDALVADEPAAFAAAIARLHDDRDLWERVAGAGREYIEQHLSPRAASRALRNVLDAAVPACRVAALAPGDDEALRAVLRDHVAEQAEQASTLVLPTSIAATPREALARTSAALEALGIDPASAPDITIATCDGPIPVPHAARAVGAQGDDADRPLASIVICAHGKREYTERCLRSLEEALGPRLGADVELVLVDNASPDDTGALFAEWADRAQVVALDENRNFAGGNNTGAAVARGRVLVFLNNDTEVGSGAIEALVDEALRESVGAVGARLVYPDGRIQHGGFVWRSSRSGHVPFHLFHYEDGELAPARASYDTSAVTGACVAIRSELFAAVGGFDEAYVNGFEDVDLCLRLRAAGTRVRYRGDVAIVHHEGVTSGGSYAGDGNAGRFMARWAKAIEGDESLVRDVLGAAFAGPLPPVPADRPDGTAIRLVGPVAGLGPVAAEARGLLRTLGSDAAARTVAATWIGVADELVLAAHSRAAAHDAMTIHVPDAGAPILIGASAHGEAAPLESAADAASPGGAAPLVLRLAAVPAERSASAVAWAATPALAEELVAAGWPADSVVHVAPCGIEAELGPGGEGTVALLPVDPALADALLDALAAAGRPARIVPVARTPEIAALVAERAPDAQVIAPITDEAAFAALCARADVVIAADPDDAFDRAALVAAGAGAAVVVRPGGAAADILGEHAQIADPADAAAMAAGVKAASADSTDAARSARSALVAATCSAAAARVRELLGLGTTLATSTARPDLGDFAWARALGAARRSAGSPRISAVINTLNEERNLEDALRSVAWVDEIVVVDMHSDDSTREIAEVHGARVLLHDRTGVVEPARNYALQQATGDWILCLDADERVPEPLARALDAITRRGDVDVVDVPFRNWLCGRWMEATGWGGGDWHVRFFRRGYVEWSDRVHTSPRITGRHARLPFDGANGILHFNYDDLQHFVDKTNRYTGKEAESAEARPWEDVVRDARREVLERWAPDVDGTQSVALSMAMLFYRFLAGAKQWERHGFPEVGAPLSGRDALRDLAGEGRLAHAAGIDAFSNGDPDAARGHLVRALREEADPEVLNDLAVACHAAGDLQTAAALLRVCLLVSPDHAAARENLACVEEAARGALAA